MSPRVSETSALLSDNVWRSCLLFPAVQLWRLCDLDPDSIETVVSMSVTDPRTGKRVALKRMPNVFLNLASCKRVFREIRMLCSFKHDNVPVLRVNDHRCCAKGGIVSSSLWVFIDDGRNPGSGVVFASVVVRDSLNTFFYHSVLKVLMFTAQERPLTATGLRSAVNSSLAENM
ncbi:unnamed protein product [Soboliphyme baturini]|uniref:Protein kinase domain-containing protein n=1 Tax=Soboliphyme baturini TaxID=241478 RepID=A0A183IFX8_9BILA|nr:unnamed protein product [Soboliphyme baturini]